jgi:preprotein translocase subunit SecB
MSKEVYVDKIYLKDSNIETPSSPDIFQEKMNKVQVTMDCNVGNKLLLPPNYYEVILEMNIVGKHKDDFLYVLNITYGGLFNIKEHTKEEQKKALGVDCPLLLFPYVQQSITNITSQTGLHPAFIQPINFEELYNKED